MKISMIAAMAKDRVIGKDNQMPWHLPADLQHFKRVTLGKPVIMGRKTFESIGRPLPGRRNLVVSRAGFSAEGVDVVPSMDAALEAVSGVDEVMVIGGGTIYELMLPRADRLYLTEIDLKADGDTRFPDYSVYPWQEIESESHSADEKNPYDYRFFTLERVK